MNFCTTCQRSHAPGVCPNTGYVPHESPGTSSHCQHCGLHHTVCGCPLTNVHHQVRPYRQLNEAYSKALARFEAAKRREHKANLAIEEAESELLQARQESRDATRELAKFATEGM